MKLPIGTYSLYNQFENCPHKAYHIYVLKDVPYVETPEMKWGNDVHSGIEHRIKDGTPLDPKMQAAEPIAAKVHGLKEHATVHVEYKLALDLTGRPVDFWSDACWFRGKIDVAVVALDIRAAWLIDWKTGKKREEPFELECGALLLKANTPKINNIVGEYFWLQEGKAGLRYDLNKHSYTFAKLRAYRNEMQVYAKAGTWPKKKNPLCGWCPVMSCEHNKSDRRKT